MAEDKKISELQENPSISGAENVVIEKSGANFKETFLKLKDWVLTFVNQSFIQGKRPLKSVGGQSLEGTGDIPLPDSAEWGNITGTLSTQTDLQAALDSKADKSNVLELDNTSAFTPSADYEPATKKYVDDNAGGTIPNAAYNVVGGIKISRDSASSTTYISFDGTDTPNVT
jgi:hypothetical protein